MSRPISRRRRLISLGAALFVLAATPSGASAALAATTAVRTSSVAGGATLAPASDTEHFGAGISRIWLDVKVKATLAQSTAADRGT